MTAPAEALKERGLRLTPRRLAIYSALAAKRAPVTAEALHAALPRPRADLATVYRSLESFEKAGLVRRVDLRHGHAHFELAGDEHHHMVCTSCQRIEDFKECGADALAAKVLKRSRSFGSITSHSLELFGLCKACITR